MRLEIHRKDYGKDSDGQWHQKVDGEWLPIPAPEWSKKEARKRAKEEKVVDIESLRMKPREGHKPKMVKVYKVTEKTVPDHEAEVLLRHGWQDYYPGTLRHNDASALS